MKATFSFGDAVNAAFVLIRRRPLTVFVWGALMIGVIAAIYAVLIPVLVRLPWGDETAITDAYATEMMTFSAVSNGLTIVMYLVMLVVFNAAGRATLAPGTRDRFLFMRVGMDEVRVAVVIVGVFMGWYLALLALILIGIALVAALWAVSEATAIMTGLLYGVAVFGLSVFAWARVSLIAPATLVLGRFAFAEGWAIGRGQVLKLVGLNLAIWLIYMAAYIVLGVIVAAILIGAFVGQGLSWPTTIDQPQDLTPIVRPMIVPLLATLPFFAFAYGAYIALVAAPFVTAARQLLDGAPLTPEAGRTSSDALQSP